MSKLIFILIIGWTVLFSCPVLLAQGSVIINQVEADVMDTKITLPAIDTAVRKTLSIAGQYPDSAIVLLQDLFKKSELLHYNYGMAAALLSTGDIYVNNKMDVQKGLRYFRKAYPYCRKVIYRKAQALVKWNNGMAEAFIMQDLYDSAMVYVSDALKMSLLLNENDMQEMKVIMYNNIATIYRQTEQYEQALVYLESAKTIAMREKLVPLLATTYVHFAFVFYTKNEFDEAAGYLKKATMLGVVSKVLKMKLDIAYGALHLKLGAPQKAIPYFKDVLSVNDQQSKLTPFCLNALGVSYSLLGDYSRGEQYLKLGLTTTAADLSLYTRYELYNNLAIVYDSLKDYKKAYQYIILAAGQNDSIKNIEKLKTINRLETLYRTAEKDKVIKSKQLKLTSVQNSLRKKNLWIASITFSALLLLLLLAFIFQRQRLHLQQAITAQEQKKVNQLKAITEAEERERSRIGRQLHDDVMVEFSIVKMNLAALPVQYPEIKKIEDYKNIERQLHLASIKLRQTAHNLMPDALLADGLVSAIHYFCNGVQRITGIQINFQHYGLIPRLPADTEISLYRTVQELIQNVIKHAAATKVLTQINYRRGHLSLTVEDNGIGIANHEEALKHGMGLKSIRMRLEAMDGNMELHKRKPHGTSVNIELNV